MAQRKKKDSSSLFVILILSLAVLVVYGLLFVNVSFLGKKSIHEDAKRYQTRHCLAFYPDSDQGRSYAKDLCKGVKDDRVYDYTLIPYGDYYLVSYGGDRKYFTDRNYDLLKIEGISDAGKKIITDYLRLDLKKEEPEKYYDPDFLKQLQPEMIDLGDAAFDLQGEDVLISLPQFGRTVSVPLKYLQKELGMDLGFPNEIYRKPVWIDPDGSHPVVCLTFDDGPQLSYEQGQTVTERIIDILYRYDACGTFYLIGVNLEDRDIWADYQVYSLLKKSINQGNEYGSHTQNHRNLTELETREAMKKQIEGPKKYLLDLMDYEMKTYRPPEGEWNGDVLEATDLPAILWDVDSEDWISQDPEQIAAQVLKYDYESGDIILFHDIYEESADALEKILPELIRRGCQLVTVTDMFRYYGIDPSSVDYFFSPSYYE